MDELNKVEEALDAALRRLRDSEIALDQVGAEIHEAKLALQLYKEAIATRAMFLEGKWVEPVTPPRPNGCIS